MSDQGGLPQGSDTPQKPSPPVQTAAAPATSWKHFENDAPPSALETNKPADSPELGENWSPLSERTDGDTIFSGTSSNDCWSDSRELRNSDPNVLMADWELPDLHSTMDLEKGACVRGYIAKKGKNVCKEALKIDGKTKLSPLGSKFENISGGKLLIPNAENYIDLASKSGLCRSDLKHLQNPSVLHLENSSGQAKLCMDSIASSSKEVQASSINNEVESMATFYTNLDSADQNHSGPHVNAHSEGKEQGKLEIYEAIELLRTLFRDKLSAVISSKYIFPLKSALSFLYSFTKEDDLSVSLNSVFLKLARVIPSIIHRYSQTNIIIYGTDNVKAAIDDINRELMENKRMYLELSSSRNAITCEIGQIEKLASFHLQQFNELKAKAEKQIELRDGVFKKIQSTYAGGTSLKRKANELDKKVVVMELEKVCAEKIMLELEHAWDTLGKLLEQNLVG